MERDIQKLISQMTLEEKAGLCSGLDFWRMKGIERLGIPSVMLTDGPHGLRKQAGESDHVGLNDSVPATCFPSGASLACSWDKELLERVGSALGEECQAENVAVLLGPAANIKRSPLCGRNFEYFSEDPYLSTEMAASHIRGVQGQGVGTSLKHYAVNNQEHRRMSVDAVVDERTLREIYLASFEGAVKQSQPWTVMCAYNQVNGDFCAEHKELLTDILKDEWGFQGFVVSDWGAVNERVDGLAAGLELEMPSSFGIGDKKIADAVISGTLPESVLDAAVERILRVVFMAVDCKKEDACYDRTAHHQLAKEAARECMVLLKNEDSILPLKKHGSLAVLGAFAQHPRYQGGGSSHIHPTQLDNIYEEITKTAGGGVALAYAAGYKLDSDEIDDVLIREAEAAAKQADAVIVFAGLPERYESEGYDRSHMRLPENHNALIEAVAEVHANVIVVLSNGSPVEMPWIGKVKGVLESYLGGQALGGAIAEILFGEANPCGKLAETFPVDLCHNPSYINFPGEGDRVEYREGLFVGYRYYDKTNTKTLFPFGHGLSYTTFNYSDLSMSKNEISDDETVTVTVKIKNIGTRTGKEIVQLYVRDIMSNVIRPEKELKGFLKIELAPEEEKTISFALGKRAFAYYNVEMKDWHVESGAFEILIGKSAAEILLKEELIVHSTMVVRKHYHRNSSLGEIMADPASSELVQQLGFLQPQGNVQMNEMMMAMMKYMPLRALVNFSRGRFTEEMMNKLLHQLNQQ